MILVGDCLDQLRALDDESIDAMITDPPYLLTNSGGTGFMGAEWDSLSVKSAVVEAFLRSMSLVLNTGEGSSAPLGAHEGSAGSPKSAPTTAQSAKKKSSDSQVASCPSTSSVPENVITRDEALVLCNELLPSHTTVIEDLPISAFFVLPPLGRGLSALNTVRIIAGTLLEAPAWQVNTTTSTSTAKDEKISSTEAKGGISFERKSTNVTAGTVENARSPAQKERSSVTTSSPGNSEYRKTIRRVISLPYVSAVIQQFTKVPTSIQILSEVFHYRWAREALRVLKPGAHVLVFGGARTAHRLTSALEDAGFECRDVCMWMYGQGFPKTANISKQIDKAAGAKRKVVGKNPNHRAESGVNYEGTYAGGNTGAKDITAPATDAAKQWDGWHTALKPAYEPIVLARKSFKGATYKNVLKYGTGALNVDACRISTDEKLTRKLGKTTKSDSGWKSTNRSEIAGKDGGRWPAHLMFDEVAAALLEYQSEGVSRFFYQAKPSKREKNAGLDNPNTHPTVKSVDLMRYLVRLITPPGGTVIDPFMGSGSTGIACVQEGFEFIGIEQKLEYAEVATKRIEHAKKQKAIAEVREEQKKRHE